MCQDSYAVRGGTIKQSMNKKNASNAMVRDESTSLLLKNLRDLIQSARQKALRAVDTVQVQTCWEIGRHIVEFEQGGAARRNMAVNCCSLWLGRSPQSSGEAL